MEQIYQKLLESIGDDPKRKALMKTPKRAADAMKFLTHGYDMDIHKVVNGSVFEEDIKDMVIVKDIEFYSLCEHHMLPFYGKCHIGYIPNKKIIGLSKLPRLVDVFARRLQIQERLSTEIAKSIEEILKPLGVGIVIEGYHLCMMMRGVEKQNSKTITSCMLGSFRNDSKTRSEFLNLITHKHV